MIKLILILKGSITEVMNEYIACQFFDLFMTYVNTDSLSHQLHHISQTNHPPNSEKPDQLMKRMQDLFMATAAVRIEDTVQFRVNSGRLTGFSWRRDVGRVVQLHRRYFGKQAHEEGVGDDIKAWLT